jgi:hypothetical protein
VVYQCAELQMLLLDEPWLKEILDLTEGREVHDANGTLIAHLRMGIHRGTPVCDLVCEMDMVSWRMEYYGPMVNRASRMATPLITFPVPTPTFPPLRIMTSLPPVSIPPAPILSNEIILDHFRHFYTIE